MANIKISDLASATLPLDLPNSFLELQTVEAGINVSRKITADDLVGSVSGLDATFITVTANASLPNERILTAGANVALVDNGAGNPIVINVSLAFDDLSDVELSGAADNDLLFRSGGSWIDTAGLLTWDGAQLILPQANIPSAPTLAFGDGDTGFYEVGDDQIQMAHAGVVTLVFRSDFLTYSGSGRPVFLNEEASDTNPTLVPSGVAISSGLGAIGGAFSAPVIISQGIEAQRWMRTFSVPGVITSSQADVGLTAHVGSSQGDGVIESSYNVYSTVANAGDAATLPSVFKVGQRIHIKNDGANSMDVFPALGDDLGAGVNTAVAVAAADSKTFIGTVVDSTWTELLAVFIPVAADPQKLVDPSANDAVVAEGLGIVAVRSVGNIEAEDRGVEWQHQDGTTQFSIGSEFFTDMIIRNHITGRHIRFNVGTGAGNKLRVHIDGDQTVGGVHLYAGTDATSKFETIPEGVKVKGGTLFLAEQTSGAQEADIAGFGQLWVDNTDDSLHYVTEAGVDTNLVSAPLNVEKLVDPASNDALVAVGDGKVQLRSVGNTDAEERLYVGTHQDGTIRFTIGQDFAEAIVIRNFISDNSNANFVVRMGVGSGNQDRINCGGAYVTGGVTLHAGPSTGPNFRVENDTFVGSRVDGGSLFIGEESAAQSNVTGSAQIWVRDDVATMLMYTDDSDIDMVVPATQFINKDADETINNSSAYQDDDELVGFQMDQGAIYRVRVAVNVSQASAASGFKLRIIGEGAGTFIGAQFGMYSISESTGAMNGDAQPTSQGEVTNTVGDNYVVLEGICEVGNGDTFKVQWAQSVATVANTTVENESYVEVTKIRGS